MTDTSSTSTGPSKDAISMLARQLWEQEGHPTGRDTELWLQAEKELLAVWEIESEPPKPCPPIPIMLALFIIPDMCRLKELGRINWLATINTTTPTIMITR
jgi:hypothetical protein